MVRVGGKRGPKIKKGKNGGRKKIHKRKDLEDLYRSVLASEKSKKRGNRKKEILTEDPYEEDPAALIEKAFTPVQKNDLTTLLGLLTDDESKEEMEENDSLDIDDQEVEKRQRDISDDCYDQYDHVEESSNSDNENNIDEDVKMQGCKLGENNEETDDDIEQEGILETGKKIEESDEEYEDAGQIENDVEVWAGFNFASFNKDIPQCEEQISLDKCVVTPPGFPSFSISTKHPNASHLRDLISTLCRNSTDVVEKDGELGDFLCGSRQSNIRQDIWTRWLSNLLPKVLKKERQWSELANLAATPSYLQLTKASTVFKLMSHYVDIILSDETYLNSVALRALSVLHIVNHLRKMRHQQATNNRNLKQLLQQLQEQKQTETHLHRKHRQEKHKQQLQEKEQLVNETSSVIDISGDDRFRDQGFTRARVLILTPTRQIAKEVIEMMLDLFPGIKQVRNRKRFEREYSVEGCNTPEERLKESEGETLIEKKKPIDFVELFRGNTSDEFKIGIRIYSSTFKLYSSLYQSDVIVASPLGLRLLIGAKGTPKREYDFLSSIEVLLIDRADVLRMQNWEHVRDVLEVTNCLPTEMRSECDIRRLRSSYIEGLSRQFRQTIILSHGRRPEINSLFSHNFTASTLDQPYCRNFRGVVKLSSTSCGEPIKSASLRVKKQFFLYLPCGSISELPNTLATFMSTLFPPPFLLVSQSDRVLLVVPSYVEYLKVRKILRSSNLSNQKSCDFSRFLACHEYTSNPNLTRSRQAFLSGKCNLMITTERFLFYRRYLLKGASHIFFLGAPEYPEIYLDCLSALRNPSTAVSCVVYTKFHAPAIERLVGSGKLKTLLNDNSSTNKLFILGPTKIEVIKTVQANELY